MDDLGVPLYLETPIWALSTKLTIQAFVVFCFYTTKSCFFPFRTGELRFAWDSVGGENWSQESGVVEHPAGEVKTTGSDW